MRLRDDGAWRWLAAGSMTREAALRRMAFRLLPRFLFRGFLVMAAKLHLAEDALTLHLLLESAERLVDVVIPDKNLHANSSF